MKKIILLLFGFVFVLALQIDINSLIKKVASNPDDIKNRLVIASYFIEHKNMQEAEKYITQVLKKDPKNSYALKMKKDISSLVFYQKTVSKYQNIQNAVNILYKNNKYKELTKLYYALKNLNRLKLNDQEFIKIARVLMWEGKYTDSLKALEYVKNKTDIDYYNIKANDLYYLGKYKQALKYFTVLYQTTGSSEYAKKLLDIYFYTGDYQKAKKLILSIKRSNPTLAKTYQKKLTQMQQKTINTLKNRYIKNQTFENLKAYTMALFQNNKQKAVNTVKDFLKTHPHNQQAVVYLAQLLSWQGENDKALKYLSQIKNSNNLEAKLLLGKILAWQGDYKTAVIYLSDVYNNGNNNEKYQAKKMLGYIYLWEGKKQKAKEIFTQLNKVNPDDEDVKEELMVLNGNIKPLIKKYLKLLKKNPKREDYILKLANYYYMLKDYDNAAYYYEKYLKIHPENLEIYKTLGDIFLEKKDFYKGFGYWEYYANYKNTKEAYYNLALRYYWNGFNKEALSVLNNILKKYPNYEDAIILKAKILKVNPRFVNSNSGATIKDYFSKKSTQLKMLADRAYFNSLYATAAEYYKDYLFLEPNDYDIHEKYAYSLEALKKYQKAAGEFFLLTWYKKTPLIEYNYAYCLQKSGKTEQAKKIYKKLLNEVPKPAPEFIVNFLNRWKKAWESMDIKQYENFYAKNIKDNLYWKLRKESIFKKASFVSVGVYDPVLIYHKGDIYKVKFFQVYASKIEKDKGYKTLTLKCQNNHCLITKEEWKQGKYIPFNKNSSLEKFIKQNLNLIRKKEASKVKLVPNPAKIDKSEKKNSNSQNPLIAPGLKVKRLNLKTALNISHLKAVKLSHKTTLTTDIKDYKFTPEYKWKIETKNDYFADNQKTLMWTDSLKLYRHIYKKYYGYIFYKRYYLNAAKTNKQGFLYGTGLIKKPFLFDIFYDNSGKTSIGWDFSWQHFIFDSVTLNINRHNMVYSRRSICSANHTKITTELTGYNQLTGYRAFWWSLAYEHVDDSNNVLTPQFEYDFYNFFLKKDPVQLFVSGWYQFNSKQSTCYYSPQKTDTTLIGFKHTHIFGAHLQSFIKSAIGYSVWDKAKAYNIGGWLTYQNKNFYAKSGCQLSNSLPTNGNIKNYQSIECILNARIKW